MPRMMLYCAFIIQVHDHGLEFSLDALLVTQLSSDPGWGGVLPFISSAGQCQPCLELKEGVVVKSIKTSATLGQIR